MERNRDVIAGVDEAGCGPLAGPVIAAAVILRADFPTEELKDSKKMNEKDREYWSDVLKEKSQAWAIGRADVIEIDQYNILQASLLAMKRAVMALPKTPTIVWVDGRNLIDVPYPVRAYIDGDALIPLISAASILAKVARDAEMKLLHEQYPQYGFAQHKGYGTKAHLAALREYGPSPVHRRSFAPVRECEEA